MQCVGGIEVRIPNRFSYGLMIDSITAGLKAFTPRTSMRLTNISPLVAGPGSFKGFASGGNS
jgi:hypothetical protein